MLLLLYMFDVKVMDDNYFGIPYKTKTLNQQDTNGDISGSVKKENAIG